MNLRDWQIIKNEVLVLNSTTVQFNNWEITEFLLNILASFFVQPLFCALDFCIGIFMESLIYSTKRKEKWTWKTCLNWSNKQWRLLRFVMSELVDGCSKQDIRFTIYTTLSSTLIQTDSPYFIYVAFSNKRKGYWFSIHCIVSCNRQKVDQRLNDLHKIYLKASFKSSIFCSQNPTTRKSDSFRGFYPIGY